MVKYGAAYPPSSYSIRKTAMTKNKKPEPSSLVPRENIEGKILLLPGKRLMLDRDRAELYGVETKMLKRAVKRNIERFPEDFMFQLSKEEYVR